MKKILFTLIFCSILIATYAQNFIAQPYYSENKIRFYNKTSPVAASPFFTFDLASDVTTAFGATGTSSGLNGVVVYNSKVFCSFAFSGGGGGVLIYNFSDIYPTRTATAPIVIKPGGVTGNPSIGMAIHPTNGNLYVATVNGPNDGGVYLYTATSNYVSASQFSSYNNDATVDIACANLAFDASNNLWMTTFQGSTTPSTNFLICYKATAGIPNKNNYYKIINTASATYSATDVSGVVHTNLHLLSQPEGIIFDASGNLWLANNNDDANANPAGNGTLVKITAAGISAILANAVGSTLTIPVGNVSIKYISNGKLGGLAFDGNNLYVNDQGQNQGSSYTTNGTVWKWDATTAFNATNFVASGIKTTYPGNGSMAFIPCTLLPAKPSVTPSSITITAGNATTLTAICAAGTTYLWSTGAVTAAISPAPTTTTNYTAYCVSGACQSPATTVTVTVGAACTPPAVPTLSASPAGIYIGNSTTLTATGCNSPNTLTWSDGLGTGTTKIVSPNATKTYTATCSNGTCASGNGSVIVTLLSTFPSPALVGYLQNWDDAGNGLPYIQLDAVPAAYNVINYAFGLAQSGTTDNIQLTLVSNVDANASTRTQTFIQKMNTVQNQGRKVLLSLGGEATPTSGAAISLPTIAKRDNFILSVTNILKTYPFDGLDIDIENAYLNNPSTLIFNQSTMTVQNPNSPTIDNLIYALKQIMLNYRTIRGRKMLLTFAPESFQVTGGLSSYGFANLESNAAYLPLITALKDSLDLVHTQLYSGGSDIGKDGKEYCGGTQGGAMAIIEDLMLGYTLNNSQGTFTGLSPDKIALGFAAPCSASAAGHFLDIAQIQGVVNYFKGTGAQPPASNFANCSSYMTFQDPYTKFSTSPVNFRGLMTWSINYDVNTTCSNNSFASTYLGLYGAFTQSTNAKNFLTFSIPSQVGSSVIDATANTITVTMPAGTNLTNLVPTFTTSPNTITAKVSGTARDFTSGVQYTVIHQDNSSKTWTVIVNVATNNFTISASPSPICSGVSTTLSAAGCSGGTITWFNYTTTIGSGQTLTYIVPTPGSPQNINAGITASCTIGGTTVFPSNISGFIYYSTPTTPTISTTTTLPINAGTSITLTATSCSSGGMYWSNGASGVNTISVAPTTTTNYTAYCNNGGCNSANGSLNVTVNSPCPPSITITTATYPSYTANQVVQGQNITTNSPPNIIINSGNSNKLTYQASNSILLNKGFSVQAGAVFSAKIASCTATAPYAYQKISYQYGTDPNGTPLIVDIYQPSVATSASRKPLIIFTHGTGNNESNPHGTGDNALAVYLAQNQGFVTAYFNFFGNDNTRLQDDGVHLLANYTSVINYLKTNASTYGINTSGIILHGASGSAAGAMSIAVTRGDIFGCIIEEGGRNIGLEYYEPATLTTPISVAGVQSQSDGGFGEYRYNAADVRSGASHNYNAWTENTLYAVIPSPGQQGYCSAWNDCSLNESYSYYTAKYGATKIIQYPLIVAGQAHGPEPSTQTAWDNFMHTKPKIMLNDRGITW